MIKLCSFCASVKCSNSGVLVESRIKPECRICGECAQVCIDTISRGLVVFSIPKENRWDKYRKTHPKEKKK